MWKRIRNVVMGRWRVVKEVAGVWEGTNIFTVDFWGVIRRF